jgi:hypothetical protein
MSKSIIIFTAISGDKLHSDFMQACDVFEKSKVLGDVQKITITTQEDVVVNDEYIKRTMDATVAAMQSAKRILTFLHFEYYTQDGQTFKNNGSITPYVNKDVRMISDGSTFQMLDDFIRFNTGLEVITDEHRFIRAVGIGLDNENFKDIHAPQ